MTGHPNERVACVSMWHDPPTQRREGCMSDLRRKPIGTTALIAGVLAVLLALLADEIGVGGEPGFAWKQGILLAVGAIVAVVGLVLLTGAGRRVVEEAVEPGPLDRRGPR